jgi:biopolymer transport protein ExbD
VGKRKEQKEEPLNLVPIMNLVTILIPVLLVAIKSVELSIIDTTLPPINTNASAPAEDDPNPPLNLRLRVTNKGIWICGADEYIGVSDKDCKAGAERKADVSCKGGGVCKSTKSYDWPGLKDKLKTIKDEADKTEREGRENVTFEPTTNVRYETLIKMMDVSREDLDVQVDVLKEDGTPKLQDGKPVKEFRQLFPSVVMSAVQTQE